MTFNKCCNKRNTVDYSLKHVPTPLHVSNNIEDLIKTFLWYNPNIKSFQSPKNRLLDNPIYNDYVFSYIIESLGMNEDNDVLLLKPSDNANAYWPYYDQKICVECQKIILCRTTTYTKTVDLLRCIRNAIAHGSFSIVNNMLIAVNKREKYEKETKETTDDYRAILKIRIDLLQNVLSKLIKPGIGYEALIGYIFEKAGYKVIRDTYFDLIVEKEKKQYVIEIKEFIGKNYLHWNQIQKFLEKSETTLPNMTRVLFIDTSRITKDVRKRIDEMPDFLIVDRANVLDFINGKNHNLITEN